MTLSLLTTDGGHLADGTLLQILDADPGVPADARSHLSACAECERRLSRIENASALFAASLPEVPMPSIGLPAIPRRRRFVMSVPLAAAATFVLLATAAAATPPVRGWIARQFSPPAPTVAPPSPSPASAKNAASILASFAPSDTALVIRIDHRQSAGVLELVPASDDRIAAQAIGGSRAEEMMVLPGQLRIANGPAAVADYRVAIPPSVRVVRVLLGGGEVAVVRVDATLHRRIELR